MTSTARHQSQNQNHPICHLTASRTISHTNRKEQKKSWSICLLPCQPYHLLCLLSKHLRLHRVPREWFSNCSFSVLLFTV